MGKHRTSSPRSSIIKRPAHSKSTSKSALKRPACRKSSGIEISTHRLPEAAAPSVCPATVEVEGHRGFGELEPHNTLRAFRAAAACPGVSSVEFDVQASADFHLVVSHGAEHGPSSVPSQTLAELQVSDLGHGERTPTLAEVVDVCLAGGLTMNVELKTAEPWVVDATLALLREKAALSSCRISSFHRAALQHVMKKAPEVPIGSLYNPSLCPMDDNDASLGSVSAPTPSDFASWFADHKVAGDSVNMRSETITAEEVREARRHGKKVMAWYPCFRKQEFEESVHEYKRMISLGVDVICCNKPDILASIVGSTGHR